MPRLLLLCCCFLLPVLCVAGVPEALLVDDVPCVPMRTVADWLHARVTVGTPVRTIHVMLGQRQLRLTIDQADAVVNGAHLTLEAPVRMYAGSAYAPVRGFCEAFGVKAANDQAQQRLTLTCPDMAQPLTLPLLRINPRDGSTLVWIPAGAFVMGTVGTQQILPCPDGALDSDSYHIGSTVEQPAHRVYLDGYWIDRCEVTVAQYRAFCQRTGRKMPAAYAAPGKWDAHPMTQLSWDDAVAYARWAGGRLPSEAEWEKAARGVDGREYPWGNRRELARCHAAGRTPGSTYPVGSAHENASPYGAYDMVGNAKEWCQDWYSPDYYLSTPWANPTGPVSGRQRVVRGSACSDVPDASGWRFRCAYREGAIPTSGTAAIGFRIVMPGTDTGRKPSARPAVPIAHLGDAAPVYTPLFPEGYRCRDAWQADLDDDGTAEVIALGVAQPAYALPPVLKVFKTCGIPGSAALVDAGEMAFDEKVGDALRWYGVSSDTPEGHGVPSGSFRVQDINDDGVLEILITLQSHGLRSHDESLWLVQWHPATHCTLISHIDFPDAAKGGWVCDELSAAHPGLELVTVGRRIDEEYPADYLPQWYTFTYYGWSEGQYGPIRSLTTRGKYLDASQALSGAGI